MTKQSGLRALPISEVCDRLSKGKATIYDWLNPGSPRFQADFPRPIRLGKNSVAWLEHDIDNWLESRCTTNAGSAPK